jgi:predicted ATP-grasp superfamily ATP-dependent carboligase
MKKNKNNPVIILGGGINALGIIRSFERTNIPVVAMSWYKDFGMKSRFCKAVICPHPLNKENFIDFLIQYSQKLSQKPVLFVTTDLFLMTIIEYKMILDDYYHIPFCGRETLEPLLKKEFLYPFVNSLNIPSPKTFILKDHSDFEKIKNNIDFPVIIKPSVNINFSKLLGSKAFIVSSDESLSNLFFKIRNKDLYAETIVLQEYIPGDTKDLYTITSYSNQCNEIVGYSIGHKIRQYPPQTGTIISGKVTHVEDILQQAEKFIKVTKFYGLSNIEFKFDNRDGKYKLMEINPRLGVWNLSALSCGVNLPLIAYMDVLGKPTIKTFNKEKEVIWLITPVDFYLSLWGYKKKGYNEFSMNFKQWLNSINGHKIDACFKWDDPLPFIFGFFKKFS